MIISLILGGLGNQFFQYAAARQLAYNQKSSLKLETFGYRFPKYARHPYVLDKFRIAGGHASLSDYLPLASRALRTRVVVFEGQGGFNNVVSAIRNHTILVGYWQNLKYFSGISGLIREEFTLKDPPSAATREMADRIRATEAVSIHVRRTDYVTSSKNAAMFEQCSPDYYRDAITLIAQHAASPHFFVFSDDHDWARTSLRTDFPMTFVTHNDVRRAYEDLALMRLCKHNIIANSTFSWWGAWLNDNPQKVVVTPRRWFKDGRDVENDLLPPEWIRL